LVVPVLSALDVKRPSRLMSGAIACEPRSTSTVSGGVRTSPGFASY
jgi:hypothetical protein